MHMITVIIRGYFISCSRKEGKGGIGRATLQIGVYKLLCLDSSPLILLSRLPFKILNCEASKHDLNSLIISSLPSSFLKDALSKGESGGLTPIKSNLTIFTVRSSILMTKQVSNLPIE
jgi:hypothetical protein